MNIVILVGSYLPKCSAVGNCMRNLAECLVEDHDVTVLCFRQSYDQPAEEWVGSQRIVHIGTSLMSLRNRADSVIKTAGSHTALWRGIKIYTQASRKMRLRFRKNSLDEKLVSAYMQALEALEHMPDLLVPTCMPYEAVEAATRYKNARPRVSLVPYLFDQFAASRTLYSSASLRKSKEPANLELERKMLEASDAVLNITWEEHVQAEFPQFLHKLRHVEHPLLVKPKNRVDGPPTSMGTMVYAGALSADIRDPSYALELVSAAASYSSVLKSVAFYVPNASSARHWFDLPTSRDIVKLHDSIPFVQLSDVYADASWLLSIGNSSADQKVSKIYEYMALGKPIVHIACRHNDITAGELASYPLALNLFQDDSKEENVKALASFLNETQGKTLTFDKVAQLFSEEIPEAIVETLLESMGEEISLCGTPHAKRES